MKKCLLLFILFISFLFCGSIGAKANFAPSCNFVYQSQNTGKIFNIDNQKNKALLTNVKSEITNTSNVTKTGSNPFNGNDNPCFEQFENLISTIYYKSLLKEKIENNNLLHVIYPNAP